MSSTILAIRFFVHGVEQAPGAKTEPREAGEDQVVSMRSDVAEALEILNEAGGLA